MSKVTGMCYVKLNGIPLRTQPGASLKPGGPVVEMVSDVNGVVGPTTKEIKAAEVKAKITHTGDLDVVAVQAIRDQTLTFETDTGQRYLIRDASVIDVVELSGKELDVTFSGQPAERV